MAVAAASSKSPRAQSSDRLKVLQSVGGQVGQAAKSAEKIVGKAAVSWGNVVIAMREAGIMLVQEIGDATSEIAEYKFGEEVGLAVHDTVETYTNVSKAMTNVRGIQDVKSIAKRQASHALKVAGKAYKETKHREQQPALPGVEEEAAEIGVFSGEQNSSAGGAADEGEN
mmetsp:Transcript_7516/g.14004  ORF Transcript_7516/g.14004 Transcript_7516/m.14004 type:complete len:170 (-) Transcript_7516:311-820(-)